MKISKFKDKKNNKDKWSATVNGKKYMADVSKYPTEAEFEQYIFQKIKTKWPEMFIGEEDYRGQIFQKVEEYNEYVIYEWSYISSPLNKTYDIFPYSMKKYPTPEDFPGPAYFVKTYEEAKKSIDKLTSKNKN